MLLSWPIGPTLGKFHSRIWRTSTGVRSVTQFGYDQIMKYEVARELLITRRAALAFDLWRERGRDEVDTVALEQITAQMRAVAAAIRELDVKNEAGLDEAISRLRSSPL